MRFDINTINPYIRVAMCSVLPAKFRIEKRVIYDYELIYVESGKMILDFNGTDFECLSGHFLLIRPGIPHIFKVGSEPLSQPHIHFDFSYYDKSKETPVSFKNKTDMTDEEKSLIQADIFENYPVIPFVTFEGKGEILNLFYPIVKKEISELESKANLIKIIDILIRKNFPEALFGEKENYGIAQQLKDFIDAGQGVNLSLTDMEKQFAYSKYYLERQFKKQFGISLIAYRNKARMENARKLLKVMSVTNVSEKLGFSSIYVFSQAYKKHFGISPGKVRK